MAGDKAPQRPPDAPGSPCPKCAGQDIAVAWHHDRNACPWAQRQGRDDLMEGEHLHRTCRTCAYNWTEATKDAA